MTEDDAVEILFGHVPVEMLDDGDAVEILIVESSLPAPHWKYFHSEPYLDMFQ